MICWIVPYTVVALYGKVYYFVPVIVGEMYVPRIASVTAITSIVISFENEVGCYVATWARITLNVHVVTMG